MIEERFRVSTRYRGYGFQSVVEFARATRKNCSTLSAEAIDRRAFVTRSLATLAATSVAGLPTIGRGQIDGAPLKLAVVGCGGRGAGAANQALAADANTTLVAMADLFPDRLAIGFESLQAAQPGRVDVPPERRFTGFDAYKHAIAAADVVILATPPAFRPAHFEEAVRMGRHVFLEKPVAVDAPGIRRILATSEEAKRKGLKVAVGLHRRHKRSFQEMIKRIHAGEIGDIVYTRSFANTPLRTRLERNPELGELEYQCRNWYYFSWLSGDFIVDNLVHGIDISNWAHGGYPVRCHGMGGLGERIHGYGNLFDHFAIEWEYAGGARLFGECDRRTGCWAAVTNHAIGTKGRMDFLDRPMRSSKVGQGVKGAADTPEPNPYQVEHDDFFAAIRNNRPYNEAEYGAKSTFTAIMGRMAAYSGKVIEWDEAFDSNLSLAPDTHSMDDPPTVHPDAGGFYPVPVPGKTEVL